MRKNVKTHHREEGFVLVTALLVMLVLTIIGIAATTNTSIELQIAGNDKVHKKTFYEAEGGASLGTEVIEQAFSCPIGFDVDDTIDAVDVAELEPDLDDLTISPQVRVFDRGNNLTLWRNPSIPYNSYNCSTAPANADAAYPIANLDASGVEVGYLQFGGETHMLPGGALQMAAGYEGKGKAAAQGGVAKMVDIYSQFRGMSSSESVVLYGWRHIVGTEFGCNYD